MSGDSVTGKQYGMSGLIGVGLFVLGVGALHFLDPSMTSLDLQISNYLNGNYGWLMLTAFLGAGIGTLAIALGLRTALAPSRSATATTVLVFVAGIGFVLAGVFKGDDLGATETSISAVVHGAASIVLMAGLIIAAWAARVAFKRSPGWEYLKSVQLGFATILTAGFFLVRPQGEANAGLTQRVFVGFMMLWLGFLAWQIRSHLPSRVLPNQAQHS